MRQILATARFVAEVAFSGRIALLISCESISFFARPRRFYAFNDVWLSDMRICENSCNLNNGKYCVCDKFVWNQRRRTLNKFQIALPIYNHWYIHIYIYPYIIDCQCFRSILDQSLGTARYVKLRPAWMASRRPNSEFPCVLGVRTNIKSNVYNPDGIHRIRNRSFRPLIYI
jgi:hypothetical protein